MWIEIKTEEAIKLYRIPRKIAVDPSVIMYVWVEPSSREGKQYSPWSLVAIQKSDSESEWVEVHITNVDEIHLDSTEYDPIANKNNYLLLEKSAVLELAELLESSADLLGEGGGEKSTIIQEIKSEGIKKYNLGGDIYHAHKQSFYLVGTEGRGNDELVASVILYFSYVEPEPADRLFIGCRSVVENGGEGQRNGGEAMGTEKLVLNKRGLMEVSQILRQLWTQMR